MSVMLCTAATFLKKNSCVVAKIASFDTIGLPIQRFSHINGNIIEIFQSHIVKNIFQNFRVRLSNETFAKR